MHQTPTDTQRRCDRPLHPLPRPDKLNHFLLQCNQFFAASQSILITYVKFAFAARAFRSLPGLSANLLVLSLLFADKFRIPIRVHRPWSSA
jgi:hypothetical protein